MTTPDDLHGQVQAWVNPFIPAEQQFPRQKGLTWIDLLNHALALEWMHAPTPAQFLDEPEPPRADGRPHPPRPTTTPPMWAVTPQQQRRRR